jgi:hypothetical protein
VIVLKAPHMTPEQQRRQDLQVQWLISALRRTDEPKPCELDPKSLSLPLLESAREHYAR